MNQSFCLVFLYKIEKKILIMLQLFKIIHAEVFKFLVIFWAIKEQVLYSPETDPDPKPTSWAPGCGFTHRLPPWCYQSVNFVSAETVMWDMAALWQVWSRHCSVHSRVGRFTAEQNSINKLQWEILVLFILIVNIAKKSYCRIQGAESIAR